MPKNGYSLQKVVNNHWADRQVKKSHKAGLIAEEQCAKLLNGTVIKGSGAVAWNKGDLDLPPNIKAEVKSTKNKSLSIKKEWLDKITGEALDANKKPAFVLAFTDERGNVDQCWIAAPAWVFREWQLYE